MQSVNKAFESNTADPLKLLSTLSNLVQSVPKKIVNPSLNYNPIKTKFSEQYLHPKPYLGYKFENALKNIPNFNEDEKHLGIGVYILLLNF